MESDRDSPERRALPPVREGYDRAAVDAYVQALSAEVETLVRASGALHDRVRALGDELSALMSGPRAGAEEPRAIEPPSSALAPPAASAVQSAAAERSAPALPSPAAGPVPSVAVGRPGAVSAPSPASPAPPAPPASPALPTPPTPASAPVEEGRHRAGAGEDLDGARLVALNLALGGESREQADRYLAERFALADRAKLLDEVYAAIEG